jgi:hypothetical protein
VVGGRNEQVSGEALPSFLGENIQVLPSQQRRPGMKKSLEKSEGIKPMFTGTMIDELIGSVERAERHAREVESLELQIRDFAVPRMELQQFIEVA